jgi:peptide/nickel transport system permease protein
MDLYRQAMDIWPELPTIPDRSVVSHLPGQHRRLERLANEKNAYTTPTMWHAGAATLVINTLEPPTKAEDEDDDSRPTRPSSPSLVLGTLMRPDYLIRRLLQFVIVLWGAATLNFFLPRLAPGNPVRERLISATSQGGPLQGGLEEMVQAYNIQFGLDQPLYVQYVLYLWAVMRLDLGYSIADYPAKVMPLILAAMPWSIGLLLTSTILAFLVGTLLGALIAWPRSPRGLRLLVGPLLALSAIPYYLLGLVLVYLFGVIWEIFPLSGGYSIGTIPRLSWPFVLDVIHHSMLPALSIVMASLGFWALGMRGMMVTTQGEDYMTFAEAKGLKGRRMFLSYGVRNAVLPQVTAFALSLGQIVSGSVVVEVVFGFPGIGNLLYRAISGSDYFVIYGVVFVTVLAIVLATIIIDLLYPVLDPRISYRRT